jgi:hypothetical protein
MHSKLIIPVLVVALLAWRMYVRMHRTFGRQRVQPRRVRARIALLGVIGALLLVAAGHDAWTLGGTCAGAACGALLALLGLRHTRFEATAEGRFYTPHTYIGLAVTALFLGRLIYDLAQFSHDAAAVSALHGAGVPGPNPYNPVTLALSGAFITYYLAYYLGVLRCSLQAARDAPVVPIEPQT